MLVLLLGIVGFLAVSCGPEKAVPSTGTASAPSTAAVDGGESVDAGEPVDGDWIVSRLPYEMATLNPLLASHGALARTITRVIYQGLLERDNETWEMKPCLAESYVESEDHLTYTFTLRAGVAFSDGTPLTSADVKFSYDAIMKAENDTLPLRNYFESILSCEAIDARTVRFRCKEPYFKTLITLGEDLRVLPKHIFSEGDFNKHPNNRKPIGTGPYVLDTWETNQRVVLTRNEAYWGEKPRIKRRLLKIITDDNAAFQLLEHGELDFLALTPDQWVNQATSPRFEAAFNKETYYMPFHGYIGWNMRKPQFADKRVRQAMTMLLNREEILATIWHGLGVVVTNSFYINSDEYAKAIEAWRFDPKRAKALLDEAGWIDSDGDGVRDKNGVAFEYNFLIPSGSPETEQLATVYKEQTEKAGIHMNIRKQEWATFIETVHNLEYDSIVLGWQLDPEQDPFQIWHSSQTEGGSNYTGLKNDEVDQLIEAARREFDHGKRVALYHRMSEIIHEEQPYTFLFCTKVRAAIDKRFRGVQVYSLGLDTRQWWVPAALQRYGR